jgi:hypothetical protein
MTIAIFILTMVEFLLNVAMIAYFIKVSTYFGKMLVLDNRKKFLMKTSVVLLPIFLFLQVV